MTETIIRFEIFQYISFVLTASLFLYMTVAFLRWFINGLKVKRPSAYFNKTR